MDRVRRKTKEVKVGHLMVGGNNPIWIQSMTNTDTRDVNATVEQIKRLTEAGCEIVRLAVLNSEAAEAIKEIKKQVTVPLVADIHFDYRLALASMESGIDKLRINPGNIGDIERVKKVVYMAKEREIPIRIGVNAGSLKKESLEKYNGITAEGLVESAMEHVEILESLHFENILVSIKASHIPLTIEAYELLSQKIVYPLHIGITETGTLYGGSIKSAVGLGILLQNGIGDTLRVSLTSDPTDEVRCAKEIIKALGIRKMGVELISCPTCGRTQIDLIRIATEVEAAVSKMDKHIKVAVMGCAVNGPGEAREADVGIAGGDGVGLIFRKGEIIKKVPEEDLVAALLREIESLA